MLELKGVHKAFGRRQVLRGIHLRVERGEILGLLGPNGSGKTTTIRIAAGYYTPDAGEVLVDDQPFGAGAGGNRAKVGYLPEQPPLYDSLTVAQYLRFVADAKRLAARARTAAIAEAVRAFQLQSVRDQPIARLSKGFRQRVGLAQAILGDPAVLLLDEATNGLDPLQTIEAREMIRNHAGGRVVIFSSHIIQEVAALCTRVVILFEGGLTEVRSPEVASDGVQQLEVEFGAEDSSAMIQRLAELPGLSEVVAEDPPRDLHGTSSSVVLRCRLEPGADLRPRIAREITSQGRLYSMRLGTTTLEDLFIEHIRSARKALGESG